MASRKLVRDLLLSRQPELRQSLLWQSRQHLTQAHNARYLGYRHFGFFNIFKKQVKGDATSSNKASFGENATALSFKEIRRRDPSFSLPEFVAEVQEMIKPILTAYLKGDVENLKKYCSPEVIERCKGVHLAYEGRGYFVDNKILHVTDVRVEEPKMMGSSPTIDLTFQTQQIYCIRDREGSITDGGKDSIQTSFCVWTMELVDSDELGEEALYSIWRIREMRQIGLESFI